jgi:hypothetical protein
MDTSRDQHSRQDHDIKADNKSFERVEEFKHFRTLTNQNSIHEEIKSRLESWNDC